MPQFVILFYQYHNVLDNTDALRDALQRLCSRLQLRGRILVAPEGINGTLASFQKEAVHAFIQALVYDKTQQLQQQQNDYTQQQAVQEYWQTTPCPSLRMTHKDFKHSQVTEENTTNNNNKDTPLLFPDLFIRKTAELINTGGVFANIPWNKRDKDT